ncbi:efflux RND transporter permease subunit [Tropicimonas sediminicola]|uniref:Multidrug efflux pump subunit AcrB n=1 Tax=Tropicimonas sediminicola TaxID=1031541 RepID=A0A239HT07_9RHOB|nr:efflux RND transporter permease subunit [Tropicimonas sediminicola]SNS84470.1 Multidrug efflux pump subunit AcrB [Tropicimonas sediminicola]
MNQDLATLTFRQPRLVAMVLIVLISAGMSSFLSLGRQEDPTITNLFATVTTSFPGADPARVEALVSSKLEEELREIAEVDTITSVSGQGISVVSVDLLETLDDATIEQVWSEARDAVTDASQSFPAGVGTPEFDAEGVSAYSAVIAIVADTEATPVTLLSRHADALAERLRNIPNTRAVDLFGVPEEEVLVTLDAQALAAVGLTADQVSAAISAADAKVQAGRLHRQGTDLAIGISGEVEALERLRRIPLREGSEGSVLTLGDVAEISRGPRTPAEEHALVDGRPAVLVGVLAQDGVQIDRWMGFVREELEAGADEVPVGFSEVLLFDQSTYTVDRLLDVGTNMVIGVAIVVGVLFLTLGVRAAAIVAIVLPVVSLATLATMNFIGLPIHQMSVTGLIVALGLLVDAAIVTTDEIRKRLAGGMSRALAVGDAVRRLIAPLIASTVTTALSFTPMILLPGPAGDFVGSIAIAVVLMLLWSLFVALAVTPALAGWLLAAETPGQQRARTGGLPGRLFSASIRWSLAHPLKSIAISLILPLLGFASLPTLTAQFFPGVERDQFYIELDMPAGTGIEATRAVAKKIDALLTANPEIKNAYWTIGKSGPAFYYNITGNRSREPGFAQAMVTTTTEEAAARLVPALQQRLDAEFTSAQVIVRGLVQGPPVAAPVELRFVGPDVDVLRQIGDEARAVIAGLDFTTQVRATSSGGAPRLRYEIDEIKARQYGLSLTEIARQLEVGLVGTTGGSLVEGTETLPIRVRFDARLRGDTAGISDLPILPPNAADLAAQGRFPGIPLSELAALRLEPSESAIVRRNGERTNTVQAFLVPDLLPEEALQSVQAALAESGFTLPAGYRLELGGDSDARSSTVGNLMASVGLIVTLTIATIALTFNSFRLTAAALVVCVLSAGLSILSLAIMQFPFGINAIIGVIGSIGVSINAAIIILTGLQADVRAASGDRAAMAEVVSNSARHIISTTVTTFGGFLPLVLEGGGFWPPFATAIAGGVLLSTVVSFYFTPALYALISRRKFITKTEKIQPAPATLRIAAE